MSPALICRVWPIKSRYSTSVLSPRLPIPPSLPAVLDLSFTVFFYSRPSTNYTHPRPRFLNSPPLSLHTPCQSLLLEILPKQVTRSSRSQVCPAPRCVSSQPCQASQCSRAPSSPDCQPLPAHLLSSGRRSRPPPRSIPAPSGRIRHCKAVSGLKRGSRPLRMPGRREHTQDRGGTTAGGLGTMHYTLAASAPRTAASAAVLPLPPPLPAPRTTIPNKPFEDWSLPACTAIPNPRLS